MKKKRYRIIQQKNLNKLQILNKIECFRSCLTKMAGSRDFLAEKNWEEEIQPFLLFEKLFFALFGVTGPSDIMISKYLQVHFLESLLESLFGVAFGVTF